MKLEALPENVLQWNGFALVGHNRNEICRVIIEGGEGALTREDFERIERALVELINREGLDVNV